jgi:hypothetical protein
VNKRDLEDRRAALDYVRMREVVAGIRLLLEGERGLP